VLFVICYIFRKKLLYLFIEDDQERILQKGIPVVTILCICEFFDIAQTTMGSILRGLGKQKEASILTFIQF